MYYKHTAFVCIDETLRNFYGSHQCDFKVYMPDKPGKYGLLFRCLADAVDRYISRVVPYCMKPVATENEGASQPIHELVMDMCSDLFYSGRNITGDRLYSAISTAEKLF